MKQVLCNSIFLLSIITFLTLIYSSDFLVSATHLNSYKTKANSNDNSNYNINDGDNYIDDENLKLDTIEQIGNNLLQLTTISSSKLKNLYQVGTINQIYKNTTYQGSNPIYLGIGNCTESSCNGVCKDNNTCACENEYANKDNAKNNSNSSQKLCSYKLYKQLTAFFLELFLILGFGHLYCGRVLNFLLKFFFILLMISLDFLFKYFIVVDSYYKKKSVYIISYFFYAIIIIWQVVDVVMFGLNKYKDGNDMPLWVYQV